jgi:hypothetical protein
MARRSAHLGWVAAFILAAAGFGSMPNRAFAHCDTLDGPVIEEARKALETGDVTPVLKWVRKGDEEEIRRTFDKARAVRVKGPEARDLADRFFFETLVRIHRAGEGAPYTGLKPAGAVEPAVAAADRSLETGSADALAKEIGKAVEQGLRERFARAVDKKRRAGHSIDAGREYVAAYIDYVHYVKRLHVAGRLGLREMRDAVDAAERGGAGAPERFAALAEAYIQHLRDHILKEDTCFFPKVDRLLTPDEHRELLAAFNSAERPLFDGTDERPHRIADAPSTGPGVLPELQNATRLDRSGAGRVTQD